MENEKREDLPRVTATAQQREWINTVLLPEMTEQGIIDRAHFSEFVRWAIRRGAIEIGLQKEMPVMIKRSAGRKKKTEVVLM